MNQKYLCVHNLGYSIGCPNRDGHNRPKTMIVGNTVRGRISSQSKKNSWRQAMSKIYSTCEQTRHLAETVAQRLIDRGVKEAEAIKHAKKILNVFSEPSKKKKPENDKNGKKNDKKKKEGLAALQTDEVLRILPEEWEAIDALIEKIAAGKNVSDDDYKMLRTDTKAVDAALFGRMLASKPGYNLEAAMSVNHTFSVHASEPEEDYFVATDDLNENRQESGSAHLSTFGFGENLGYTFCCIDTELLLKNLGGDKELMNRLLSDLMGIIMKVTPDGKKTAFADSKGWAVYLMAEWCDEPRSLAVSFIDAVEGKKMDSEAIERIKDTRSKFEDCYGEDNPSYTVDVVNGRGKLDELKKFVTR